MTTGPIITNSNMRSTIVRSQSVDVTSPTTATKNGASQHDRFESDFTSLKDSCSARISPLSSAGSSAEAEPLDRSWNSEDEEKDQLPIDELELNRSISTADTDHQSDNTSLRTVRIHDPEHVHWEDSLLTNGISLDDALYADSVDQAFADYDRREGRSCRCAKATLAVSSVMTGAIPFIIPFIASWDPPSWLDRVTCFLIGLGLTDLTLSFDKIGTHSDWINDGYLLALAFLNWLPLANLNTKPVVFNQLIPFCTAGQIRACLKRASKSRTSYPYGYDTPEISGLLSGGVRPSSLSMLDDPEVWDRMNRADLQLQQKVRRQVIATMSWQIIRSLSIAACLASLPYIDSAVKEDLRETLLGLACMLAMQPCGQLLAMKWHQDLLVNRRSRSCGCIKLGLMQKINRQNFIWGSGVASLVPELARWVSEVRYLPSKVVVPLCMGGMGMMLGMRGQNLTQAFHYNDLSVPVNKVKVYFAGYARLNCIELTKALALSLALGAGFYGAGYVRDDEPQFFYVYALLLGLFYFGVQVSQLPKNQRQCSVNSANLSPICKALLFTAMVMISSGKAHRSSLVVLAAAWTVYTFLVRLAELVSSSLPDNRLSSVQEKLLKWFYFAEDTPMLFIVFFFHLFRRKEVEEVGTGKVILDLLVACSLVTYLVRSSLQRIVNPGEKPINALGGSIIR